MTYVRTARFLFGLVLTTFCLFLAGCEQPEILPWPDTEFADIHEQIEDYAEAYALLDICIPMLENDAAAKFELLEEIKADRYARLVEIDTGKEREKVFAFYKARGGTPEQNQQLRAAWEDAYEEAVDDITSVNVCVRTITDYANTIINMRVTRPS